MVPQRHCPTARGWSTRHTRSQRPVCQHLDIPDTSPTYAMQQHMCIRHTCGFAAGHRVLLVAKCELRGKLPEKEPTCEPLTLLAILGVHALSGAATWALLVLCSSAGWPSGTARGMGGRFMCQAGPPLPPPQNPATLTNGEQGGTTNLGTSGAQKIFLASVDQGTDAPPPRLVYIQNALNETAKSKMPPKPKHLTPPPRPLWTPPCPHRRASGILGL